MPQLTASDRIGMTVGGRYEIRRLLGEGGFSSVFEAVHNVTGRDVALKLLHPHLVTTEQITERFLMEARAMARIRHDGIVQVLDAGKDPDGTVYIALELLTGESLETTLHRAGRLTWGEAVGIGIDVLGALAEAHRNKIIHRDIKPGNIFITRKPDGSSQAKLLDFGIAHVAQAKGKLTQQGMILGTPEYMSPEQGRSGNIGPEADLWSVGIVLYECITGGTPFMSENTTEILVKVQTENAPNLVDVDASVPVSISALVRRALERDVAKRFRSADEMREAMQRAVQESDKARASATSRSVLRGPSIRREPPQTIDEVVTKAVGPATGGAPRTEVLPVGVVGGAGGSQGRAALNLSRPTSPEKSERPEKPAAQERVPGGGRTFELPDPDARSARASRPDEPRQMIKPGRLVVEEVVSSRRFDDDPGRRVRKVPSPSPDAAPSARAPAETPRFSLDDIPSATPSLGAPSEPPRAVGNAAVNVRLEPPPPAAEPTPERVSGPEVRRPSAPVQEATPAQPRGVSSAPTSSPADASRSAAAPPQTPAPRVSSNFHAPPTNPRVNLVIGGSVAAVVIGLVIAATRGGEPVATRVSPDAGDRPAAVDAGGAAAAPALRLRLREANVVLPTGRTGEVGEIARHAAASRGEGLTTQRVIAACAPGPDGRTTVYFHPLLRGEALGSATVDVACAGFDLAVVSDVTGDGTDDVVAVTAGFEGVALFDSATRRVARTFPLSGARGFAVGGGFVAGGEVHTVVYTEPGGDEQPATLVALGLRSGRILWRQSGRGGLGRFGQPVELGLAVGRDANRDGVADVVVGIGPIVGRSLRGERPQRCVQLLSGATGEPLWSPKCRARGHGSQSVSLGPDVNGDGTPDVAVGAERPERGEPAVELRSGVDGAEIRTVTLPAGVDAPGFGWPVALLGAMDGSGATHLAVGSVGGTTSGVFVFDPRRGGLEGRLDIPGVGGGTLRLFGVESNVRNGPWSLVVGTPNEGVKVFSVAVPDEPES